MQIAGLSQSFSLTSVRLTLATRSDVGSSSVLAKAPDDRLTLSPRATSGASPTVLSEQAPVSGEDVAQPAPLTESQPSTPVDPKTEALFKALDADEDGAISEKEFSEGAMQLLRKAGARHRQRGKDDDDRHDDRPGRGLGRLERRLERLFDRVDADGDGSIARDELAGALAQADSRRGDAAPAPQPTPESPAAHASGVTVSVTFVSVSFAVQRYTALKQDAPTVAPAPVQPDIPTVEAKRQPAYA